MPENKSKEQNADYIAVYSAHGQLEAETIKAFLQSFDIPVLIYQESVGVTFGFTTGPLGIAKILVPKENAEDAKKLLLDMETGKYDGGEEPQE